ncbi:MAG: hypothetical protein AAGG07_07150 [Planctomycetota bacterium]
MRSYVDVVASSLDRPALFVSSIAGTSFVVERRRSTRRSVEQVEADLRAVEDRPESDRAAVLRDELNRAVKGDSGTKTYYFLFEDGSYRISSTPLADWSNTAATDAAARRGLSWFALPGLGPGRGTDAAVRPGASRSEGLDQFFATWGPDSAPRELFLQGLGALPDEPPGDIHVDGESWWFETSESPRGLRYRYRGAFSGEFGSPVILDRSLIGRDGRVFTTTAYSDHRLVPGTGLVLAHRMVREISDGRQQVFSLVNLGKTDESRREALTRAPVTGETDALRDGQRYTRVREFRGGREPEVTRLEDSGAVVAEDAPPGQYRRTGRGPRAGLGWLMSAGAVAVLALCGWLGWRFLLQARRG